MAEVCVINFTLTDGAHRHGTKSLCVSPRADIPSVVAEFLRSTVNPERQIGSWSFRRQFRPVQPVLVDVLSVPESLLELRCSCDTRPSVVFVHFAHGLLRFSSSWGGSRFNVFAPLRRSLPPALVCEKLFNFTMLTEATQASIEHGETDLWIGPGAESRYNFPGNNENTEIVMVGYNDMIFYVPLQLPVIELRTLKEKTLLLLHSYLGLPGVVDVHFRVDRRLVDIDTILRYPSRVFHVEVETRTQRTTVHLHHHQQDDNTWRSTMVTLDVECDIVAFDRIVRRWLCVSSRSIIGFRHFVSGEEMSLSHIIACNARGVDVDVSVEFTDGEESFRCLDYLWHRLLALVGIRRASTNAEYIDV